MGVESQENRGIPRNRKCGNCRYYEAAPLWRKGWCRNPKLYPPHANHLVDANTIDCEGGFRSRIYWEPIVSGQVTPPATPEVRPVAPAPANITPIAPVASSKVNPVVPVTPPSNFTGAPAAAQPINPSTEAYQQHLRPMEQPTLNVYKHPLADRNFARNSGGEGHRPLNPNPSPIISRASFPVSGQETAPAPSNNRPPLTPPSGGSETQDNNFPSYAPKSNRSYSSQEPVNRTYTSQEPVSRPYSSQEPFIRKNPAQDQVGRDNQPPQATQPFLTPPPQGYGSGQAYGDIPGYPDAEPYNQPGPVYSEQPPTRPYQTQSSYSQPSQYTQPQISKQPQYMPEQEMPPINDNDVPPGNYPPQPDNNYSQQPNNYSTQPGNYSSQYGAEKEPIKIQEALPVNSRPRPLDPRKQPQQPTPVRFRPVADDHPAANQPVANRQPGRDWRTVLREKVPAAQNWNLEKITLNRQTLPFVVAGILGIILIFVIIGNLGGKNNGQNNPTVPAGTSSALSSPNGQATTAGQTTAAATLSATVTPVPVKTATVKGTGATLNVRETPSLNGKVVTTVKDGEKVTIKEGPREADGRTWYQLEYAGKVGWAVKDYLDIPV